MNGSLSRCGRSGLFHSAGRHTAERAPRSGDIRRPCHLCEPHLVQPRRTPGSQADMGKKGRVFVRGLTSETYGLGDFRKAAAPSTGSATRPSWATTPRSATRATARRSRTWWRIGPATRNSSPRPCRSTSWSCRGESSNDGHGHQNEAAFYILEGRGYEIHDDQRYDWEKDDLVFVHTDSVHRHFNPYREGRRPRRQGEVHVDVHGPDPAGPQRPGGERRRSSARAKTGRRSGPPASWTARRSSSRPTAPGRRPSSAGSGS